MIISPRKTRIIDSLLWRYLPDEVVDLILDWLVVGHQRHRKKYNIRTLSLVCRQWRQRFRPHLWLSLTPPWGIDAAELLLRTQISTSAYRNATTVYLVKIQHLTPDIVRQLLTSLPLAKSLTLNYVDWSGQTCANPHWGKTSAGSLAGFSHLRRLMLWHCKFNSSFDILCLLAALPGLWQVTLSEVHWTITSAVVPWRRRNQLSVIETFNTDITSLLPFWSLPFSNASQEPFIDEYPGFGYEEVRILMQIIGCMSPNCRYSKMILEKSPYSRTCMSLHFLQIVSIILTQVQGRWQ